jgi:hypothetical protein
MTVYSSSSDIPVSCRTKLEALAVWIGYTMAFLYPNQRWKENEDTDPIQACQVFPFKAPGEGGKSFVTIRMTIQLTDNWELALTKPWGQAVNFPNSGTVTGNSVIASD